MDQLGIFAKYWQAGAVKTRLAATIGDLAASRVYREFVRTLLRRLDGIADRRVLAYCPPESRADFLPLAGSRWTLQPQHDGDLGARMRHYFGAAFAAGARRVVLVGSDSPTLPIETIQQAFQLLDSRPVVLGPSGDGGYYLVGAAQHVPPIFEGVSWSTAEVWNQTVNLLASAGSPFGQLPPWYDVDSAEDLEKLHHELTSLAAADSTWEKLLHVVQHGLKGEI